MDSIVAFGDSFDRVNYYYYDAIFQQKFISGEYVVCVRNETKNEQKLQWQKCIDTTTNSEAEIVEDKNNGDRGREAEKTRGHDNSLSLCFSNDTKYNISLKSILEWPLQQKKVK